MSVGFVMLVDTALDRAAQVARHWAGSGCPVVIHVDATVARVEFETFRDAMSGLENVRFTERRQRCDRGGWPLVAATIQSAERMLEDFPGLGHVYLASGSCLPLRPVPELLTYLARHPRTDFIESVAVEDRACSRREHADKRFYLRLPFLSTRQPGMKRRMPDGVVPHQGSQWWCLSRPTLQSIFNDPRRAEIERFFRRDQFPGESYFQSVARLHSGRIESRALTLAKVDHRGTPYSFHDDHLELLRRSDCFVARKIWPGAERLYSSFLSNDPQVTKNAEPSPGKIDRLFAKASDLRLRGRTGLYMQSRFPTQDRENGRTAGPFSVFEGFNFVFDGFETWLAKVTGCAVHGHLFGPERVEFTGGETSYRGGLSDSAALRDYNPCGFLTSLLWNTRGERQCFMYGPADNQTPQDFMIGDPHAQISVITGAWAIGLFRTGITSEVVRKEAARLQRIEQEHVEMLRAHSARAKIRIWTLAEFVEAPMDHLQEILDEISLHGPRGLTEVPRLADLTGFGQFLQQLRNDGMNLHMAGNFPAGRDPAQSNPQARPYLVR